MKRFAEIRDEVERAARREQILERPVRLAVPQRGHSGRRPDARVVRPDQERRGRGRTLERFAFRIEPLLKQNGRWADYGRVIKNPVERVKRSHT